MCQDPGPRRGVTCVCVCARAPDRGGDMRNGGGARRPPECMCERRKPKHTRQRPQLGRGDRPPLVATDVVSAATPIMHPVSTPHHAVSRHVPRPTSRRVRARWGAREPMPRAPEDIRQRLRSRGVAAPPMRAPSPPSVQSWIRGSRARGVTVSSAPPPVSQWRSGRGRPADPQPLLRTTMPRTAAAPPHALTRRGASRSPALLLEAAQFLASDFIEGAVVVGAEFLEAGARLDAGEHLL